MTAIHQSYLYYPKIKSKQQGRPPLRNRHLFCQIQITSEIPLGKYQSLLIYLSSQCSPQAKFR